MSQESLPHHQGPTPPPSPEPAPRTLDLPMAKAQATAPAAAGPAAPALEKVTEEAARDSDEESSSPA
eukprot:4972179-Alexandrium_andersonii.AAC.1